MSQKRIKANLKFWLETEDGYIFGEGPFELLSKISALGTLTAAAKALDMSYRHAWGIVKNVEKRLGTPILETRKGGPKGGGGAELTEEGRALLDDYYRVREAYAHASRMLSSEDKSSQLTGLRGQLSGKVVKISQDRAATVEIQIMGDSVATFLLSKDLAEEKKLAPGVRLRLGLKDAVLQAAIE
jgi:molybdate transport repressor ModE-like protein